MKNIAFYLICIILPLAFISCQQEDDRQESRPKSINFTVHVDQLQTGVKARANIPSETGENKVNSLYLIFYKYDPTGNGVFAGYHKVDPPLQMGATITVPTQLTSGATVSVDQPYTVLAFANVEESAAGAGDGYVDDISNFLAGFSNHTENSALNQTQIDINGVGKDEENDSRAISSANLFMSARIVKAANEDNATINLIRGMARIDLQNEATTHNLVSASIWSAAQATALWENIPVAIKRTERFYGIKDIAENQSKGKLYAFENSVASPALDDAETTCVVVGLEEAATPGIIKYYRINVNQDGAAQRLLRNYCYQLAIKSVTGEGAGSELEAWTRNKNELTVSVNNWNLDENGIILTDGVNTLGLGVKLIRLNPEGDDRDFSLYTIGTGTLQISKTDMPTDADGVTPGFTATITGNTLKVKASPLPSTMDKRRGSIEISFAGLRGSIYLIQEPTDDKILTLDRNTIEDYSPLGRTGMNMGPLTVTASGDWVAEIYNTDDFDPVNPGFSFAPSGDPVIRLESHNNPLGDRFQIYTTGDNPHQNNTRSGFVLVYLVEDPDNYSVALPLTQSVQQVFKVEPVISTQLEFNANGSPSNTYIATGNMYTFTVAAGGSDWIVEMDGGNSEMDQKFEVIKPSEFANYFTIKAVGQNMSATVYSSLIKISRGENFLTIPVIQKIPEIKASFSGQISPQGGSITISVESMKFKWDAEIIQNWNSGSSVTQHLGWLESSTDATPVDILTAQVADGKFKATFGPLDFPLVNKSPKMTIKVSVHGAPDIYQLIEVVQLPLAPPELKVMDVRHYSYGSLGGTLDYLTGYNTYLRRPAFFGINGTVKLPTITVTEIGRNDEPGNISSEYRYLHAGGHNSGSYSDARYQSVENWRLANDGIVVFASDNSGNGQFTNVNSTLTKLGFVSASPVYDPPARINTGMLTNGTTSFQRNIMRYLLNDGPFGKVVSPGSISFTMNSVCTSLENYPATGAPVIVNDAGKALLVIDPDERLVFIGESQMFDSGYDTNINTDKERFLGNLLSYILNTALNGSAFSEAFKDDTTYNSKFAK